MICQLELAGVFLFLAITIDRLQHYVGELCVRKKQVTTAGKRIKQLESERKEVNDAEANNIDQRKKLLDENQFLKNQLGLLRARHNDQDSELGAKAKETTILCKRIKQQESELGTKTKETTTLCRKIKQLESQLESKTKETTMLGTRVKQLELELETKEKETTVLSARLEQLEFECQRETNEKTTSVVRLKELEYVVEDSNAARINSLGQKNQLERSLVEFDRLLDGNETLKNQLRSLPWRLSH